MLQHVLELVASIAALVLLPKLYIWLHLAADDKRRAYLEEALVNGLSFAVHQLIGSEASSADIDAMKQNIVTMAGDYAKASVPDALKGLNISDPVLEQLLEARIPILMQDVLLHQ